MYEEYDLNDLPDDWNALPGSSGAAAYGDTFLTKGIHLGLIVPSAVIPEARNIVINPNHPMMREVTIEIIRDFSFDSRFVLDSEESTPAISSPEVDSLFSFIWSELSNCPVFRISQSRPISANEAALVLPTTI